MNELGARRRVLKGPTLILGVLFLLSVDGIMDDGGGAVE